MGLGYNDGGNLYQVEQKELCDCYSCIPTGKINPGLTGYAKHMDGDFPITGQEIQAEK